jgi:hypothetical protein
MASNPSNRELLQLVRAWVAANYPGCTLDYITIHLLRGRYEVHPVELADDLPGAPVETTAAPAGPGGEERADDDGIPLCVKDIMQTLREVGQPLTMTLLKKEMAKRGFKWHERTLKKYLAELMEEATIENLKDVRPPGYRLTAPELVEDA